MSEATMEISMPAPQPKIGATNTSLGIYMLDAPAPKEVFTPYQFQSPSGSELSISGLAPEIKKKNLATSDNDPDSDQEKSSEVKKENAKEEEIEKELQDLAEEKPEAEQAKEPEEEKMKLVVDKKALAIRSITMAAKFMSRLIFNNSTDLTLPGDKFELSQTPPEGPQTGPLENHSQSWADTVNSLKQLKNVSVTDAIGAVHEHKPMKLKKVKDKKNKKILEKINRYAFKAALKQAFPKGSRRAQ